MGRVGTQGTDGQERPCSAPRGDGGRPQRQCEQQRAVLRGHPHCGGSGEHPGGVLENRGLLPEPGGEPCCRRMKGVQGTLAPRGAASPYAQGLAPSRC